VDQRALVSDEPHFKVIGRPLLRREDERLLKGAGRFTDDFSMAGQTYAAVVRSPYPHARIVSLDSVLASSNPGVLGVFTGQDSLKEEIGPIPHAPAAQSRYDLKLTAPGGGVPFIGSHRILAIDEVRYVGEAVALVVAETMAAALDAAELVKVEYQELPFVIRSEDALAPDAPLVWQEPGTNVFVDTMFGDEEATAKAFGAADHVIGAKFIVGRVTAVAMEPRSALGSYDRESDRYTLYAGSGGAVKQKKELASVLNIAPAKLRVLSFDVGGNFGSRNRPYVEFALVLWASKKIGRPVKFTASRSESFLTDYQGRDLVTHVELAIRADGRFLAMRADNIGNSGALCVSLSPLYKGTSLITGVYDIPCAAVRARSVFTHTMPVSAYRSSGRPEVTFAIERLIDIAAVELGMDRVQMRRKNLVRSKAMPYKNPVGVVYDSGQYESNMDIAMQIADFAGFKARKKAARKRGKLLGIGISNYVEASSGAPGERAEIVISPEGRIAIVIGTQPSGQGHETSFAQVAADLLFVPSETVDIIYGDTDIVSAGGGSHSGRSMRHAATVISVASRELVARAKRATALVLGVSENTVLFSDGRFSSPKSNKTFDFFELAREISDRALPQEFHLAVAADNEMHEPVFPNGCAICEVEIDPDTGCLAIVSYAAVDDVGRCINPMIVRGQTHGGIAQGVGQALLEQCSVELPSGQPLCGSFMDYGIPRADMFPEIKDEIVEVLSPTNPLGIKAGGEGGTTPALSAAINAIIDALGSYGIRDIEMPATSHAIWQAMQSAKASQSDAPAAEAAAR
jgi:carbon-monoxide dehydrogenase large subunit